MNPLLARLAKLRRAYWALSIASGAFAVVALIAFALVLAGLFDFQTHAPALVRAVFLLAILAGCGLLFFGLTLYPLARRTDNLSLALRVEEAYPELNDSLASTIQFLDHTETDPTAAQMQQAAIARAAAQTEGLDFRRVLRIQPLLLLSAAALGGVVACGVFAVGYPEYARTALLRLADPFGNHTWTTIDVANPKSIWPVGTTMNLRGEVRGIKPRNLRFELQVEDPKTKQWVARTEKKLNLVPKAADSPHWTFQLERVELENRKAKVRYRVSGNDGQFPRARGSWQVMNLEHPPQIQSTQIELHLPEYLGMPSPEPSHRSLQVKLGTIVDFKATLTRPVREATLEMRPASPVQVASAAAAFLGTGNISAALTTGVALQNTMGRFPFTLEDDGSQIRARFMPLALGNGSYLLTLIDKETTDLVSVEKSDLIVADDPLPLVKMHLPATSGDYLPDAEIQFDVEAWDDKYGLKNVYLEVRRKNAEGKEDAPTVRVLADPRLAGAALRQIGGLGVPWENLAGVKPPQLRSTRVWPLKNEFQEGDVLFVRACASDYFDVFAPREPGRNASVLEIRIVGEKEVAKNIDQKMADVQADLLRLKKKQEEAQDLLKDVKADKIDQQAFDQMHKAAEEQKAIKEAAANLQKKLEDAQRMLKENKWPNSEEKDLLRNIDGELERMQQQDFPKLEAELNQAKREAAGIKKPVDPEKKGPKESNDAKPPLDKAKDLQNDVKRSLDDLTKSVSKWADLAQKKMELRELIAQQDRVANETKQIQEKIDELRNSGLDKQEIADAIRKLELDKRMENVANDQKNVGKEAGKFVENLEGLKERLAEKGDKESAQKIGDAKQVSDKNSLPKKMTTDIPNQLKNENEMKQAMQSQADAGNAMKEMLKKLEGNREDALDRLQSKKNKIKDAKDDLDKLIKKGQDAAKIADPMKQADELKKIADQAREEAKELQRLGEQRAAREIENAAKLLDDAAKKAEQGAENKEEQKEALDRINDARDQLEEFEEQLEREQLAKIADRLQFLKERQDAAIERTKELHKKVMAKKSWTMPLLKSLDGDQKNQDSIAKDAQTLKDKLKGAPVFETILDMAGQSMEKAAAAQKERKDVGKDRQFGPGQAMDEDEIKDEDNRHNAILRQQNQAAARLQRLLDAVSEQPVAKKKKPQPEQKDPNMPPMGIMDNMPKGRPGDGLPPMAELKALKGEQEDLLKRTKEFHDAHPDLTRLTEQERAEFDTIQTEQNRLRNLFDRMMEKAQKGVQQ